jgi:hypothetical protein
VGEENSEKSVWTSNRTRVWRIRRNEELRELYKAPDLVVDIKMKRLEWLGHVIRMDQRRAVKKIFDSKPEERIKVGRPRLRWLDDVENDLRVMKIKRWRKNAQNRKEWASVIKEAKVLKGP